MIVFIPDRRANSIPMVPRAGVSLIFRCDVISVTSIPSVFMEREASELRRGRPTVALDIVKVPVHAFIHRKVHPIDCMKSSVYGSPLRTKTGCPLTLLLFA